MTTPVTLIGGYLGAGKTTLVNHLLRNADGVRLAVLVNEFGDLPIDADLIDAQDDTLISIAGGCICCSFGDDLAQAIRDLGELEPTPEHVIIETSGVALPGSIVLSLGLMNDVRHDGTIVLANADTIREQAADTYIGDTIHRQLSDADLVVLNKVDLADDAVGLANWLGTLAPGAEIVPARFGKVPPQSLLQSFLTRKQGTEGHGHLDGFDTFRLKLDMPVDADTIARTLADKSLAIVRAKGFVRDRGGAMKTIQTVARRWEVSDAPDGVSPGLIVIGRAPEFNPDRIRHAVAEPAETE